MTTEQIFIQFSLGMDLLLGGMLLFLWVQHRSEKHAMYWALGQLAMAACTATYFWSSPTYWKLACTSLTLTASVAAFWAGTKVFRGQRSNIWNSAVILNLAIASAVLYASSAYFSAWTANITASVYGLAFVWVGYSLVQERSHVRVLGWIFLLRGTFNLANGFSLLTEAYQGWIVLSFFVKGVCLMCLIYAVQQKIQRRYANTIDSLSSGFIVLDSNGVIRNANACYAQLIGQANATQLIGTHASVHLREFTVEMVSAYLKRFTQANKYPHTETAILRSSRGTDDIPVELIASPHHEDGELFCMMLVIDISERKRKDYELYQAAHFDNTTGMYNRNGVSQKLSQLLLSAKQETEQCAVLMIDIDHFKRINDSFGHKVGDQLLKQFALRLSETLSPDIVIGRFGADEFVVVLSHLPMGTAQSIAESCAIRILNSLTENFDLSPYAITISTSIGVACFPENGLDGDTLIRNADIAMHNVKASSRGTLRLFSAQMSADAREAFVIDGALRKAVAANELSLAYQPIINLTTGLLEKVEALVRWQSATLGSVGPDRFIPIAEDSDLIIDLGTWVLREACRQLGEWQSAFPSLIVSINVSARQLLDPSFLGMVTHALQTNNLSPQQIELELTERVLIGDVDQVRLVIDKLQCLGVSISLDDFGTGYSSLSYLTRFQINTLKIDRSFIAGMVTAARSKALVSTIIAMGQSLGMKLVAEGVETVEQARILRELGCHFLQGYYIARPLGGSELLTRTISLPNEALIETA